MRRSLPDRLARVLGMLVVLLAVVYGVGAALGKPREDRPYYAGFLADRVHVHAHQGGDHLWPGNTMLAFENAVALGVDVLELDTQVTADGVVVVIHDDTVDRTTNGSGAVAVMTLEELRELDAAYRWRPPGGPAEVFPHRGEGHAVPTLAEVLEAFPTVGVNLDMKAQDPRVPEATCEVIRAAGRVDSVMVASFHDANLSAFRRACPEVATSAGPGEVRDFYAFNLLFLGRWTVPAADAFQVPVRQGFIEIVTPRMVRGLRERNVRLDVWTINDEAEMRRLLDLGVSGIITDRPDLALALLGR
ncbi:MAG: glycerophosphodiester phosphodiesterase [Trueperaceae bacterium]|nr:glycerophosphodiester phosphodiesterase [Trueperaceae bacterium]